MVGGADGVPVTLHLTSRPLQRSLRDTQQLKWQFGTMSAFESRRRPLERPPWAQTRHYAHP